MSVSWGARLVVLLLASTVVGCRDSTASDLAEVELASPVLDLTIETETKDPAAPIVATVAALRRHWEQRAGTTPARPLLQGGVLAGSATDVDDLPRCGRSTVAAEELADNALYCAADDSMIVDMEGLGRTTLLRHGPVGVALVAAHEMGHSLQRHTASDLDPLVAELQADCWAGEFAAAVVSSEIPGWRLNRHQLAAPARVLLELGDLPGTDTDREGAHGTGFDRLSAFLDGLAGGAKACNGYIIDPPVITGQPFVDAEQVIMNGRRSLSDLVLLARHDLDVHYSAVGETLSLVWQPTAEIELRNGTGCLGDVAAQAVQFCVDGSVVAQKAALEDLASKGDAAVMAELARGWSIEASRNRWTRAFDRSRTNVECLVGYWLGMHHPASPSASDYPYVLPPGAIDEVVDALLDQPAAADPLSLLSALIDGFLHGRKACDAATTPSPSPSEDP